MDGSNKIYPIDQPSNIQEGTRHDLPNNYQEGDESFSEDDHYESFEMIQNVSIEDDETFR